ncbi:MAG: S9 family peptidase [Acidobacteriota bacterium]|nr:S9 family peptidase [Acidobacteriota bacterium]
MKNLREERPYGSWASPLTAARVTAGALRLDQIHLDGNDVYWVEGRASEGGRYVIVRMTPDGVMSDVTPAGFNVRSRVHEYGGAAYTVDRGTIYFSNFEDQRLYRQTPGQAPEALTPKGYFYADYRVEAVHKRLIAVREDHTRGDAAPPNTIVAIQAGGAGGAGPVLVSGADFYSDPIVSPNGQSLAWIQWNHPNMPWDGTELWIAAVKADGSLGAREKIAGGPDESIFQPEWSPDGTLYFVSDRSGWWNLYRSPSTSFRAGRGPAEPVHAMAAEFGKPQWTFGMVTYAFISRDRLVATYVEDGRWRMALVDTGTGKFEPIDLHPSAAAALGAPVPLQPTESIRANPRAIYFVGGSATEATAIVRVPLDSMNAVILRSSSGERIQPEWISVPEAVTFRVVPKAAGDPRDVHAFYYPPTNPGVTAPDGERPPLLVLTHGGPTGATSDVLDPEVQFWTSRGFAVLDVNYSGSTGYGRPYRDRLKGQWGIVDVEDAVGGAEAMVAQGKADAARLMIRGGSAGGYTTLAALTFHSTFKAGASYYGISDIEVLAHDTHKFESRYLDSLIGPYPAARDLYVNRSPIHFTDRLSCPLILFQGLEDKVVPPNQSAMMAEALKKKGVKVAYVTFEGEQHGFRKAENIIRALEEELAFYRDVFGVPGSDPNC